METVTDRGWRDDTHRRTAAPFITSQNLSPALLKVARTFQSLPFEPHPLFKSGHAQTVLAALRLPRYLELRGPKRHWEPRVLEIEPGVHVLVKCRWQKDRKNAPTLLLVHGLEGSAESVYVRGTGRKAFAVGFNVVRMNQRTCGGTEHLTPTLYHSGLFEDIDKVFRLLVDTEDLPFVFIGGFSMSGNMVLRLAGQYGDAPPLRLAGITAISPSLDMFSCAEAVERPENRLYLWSFMRSLHRRIRLKQRLHPELYDTNDLKLVRTIREFDERFTAPHGGFRDADHYYTCTSSLAIVPQIRVPALVIHAEDDPIVPSTPLHDPSLAENPNVLLMLTARGGHTAFIGRKTPHEDRYWAENRIVDFCRLVGGPKE